MTLIKQINPIITKQIESTAKLFRDFHSYFVLGDHVALESQATVFSAIDCYVKIKYPLVGDTVISTRNSWSIRLDRFLNSLSDIVNHNEMDAILQSEDNYILEFKNNGANTSSHTNVGARLLRIRDYLPQFNQPVRLGRFENRDMPILKKSLEFAFTKDEPGLSIRRKNSFANVLIKGERVFSTDGYFGYSGRLLKSKISDSVRIPYLIAKILSYSDDGFVIRTFPEGLFDFELENDHCLIRYRVPELNIKNDLDFPFKESFTDTVIVNKDEFIDSILSLRRFFPASNVSNITNDNSTLQVCINGSFISKPLAGEVFNEVHDFSKNFTENVTLNTCGRRLLKILKSIDEDTVRLRIPRNGSSLMINESFVLMSWVLWD